MEGSLRDRCRQTSIKKPCMAVSPYSVPEISRVECRRRARLLQGTAQGQGAGERADSPRTVHRRDHQPKACQTFDIQSTVAALAIFALVGRSVGRGSTGRARRGAFGVAAAGSTGAAALSATGGTSAPPYGRDARASSKPPCREGRLVEQGVFLPYPPPGACGRFPAREPRTGSRQPRFALPGRPFAVVLIAPRHPRLLPGLHGFLAVQIFGHLVPTPAFGRLVVATGKRQSADKEAQGKQGSHGGNGKRFV